MNHAGPADRFLRGILPENPVFRQLLGMCPTLAVTSTLAGALTMGVATSLVLAASSGVVSLFRHHLRPHLRILFYTLTISTFVTIADRVLAAWLPEMSQRLGPYVPLIIVNCILVSRAEACASREGLSTALADAAGQGFGFTLGLGALGFVRELLGAGTLLGHRVLPDAWPGLGILLVPPGAFLTLGLLIGLIRWREGRE